MKKEKNLADKITNLSDKAPVSSPFFQEKLVSKVNALTFNNRANSLSNPQTKNFNNDKGLTLNYKMVVEELVKIPQISSITEFYSKIYSIITQNIDSDFIAVGLFKEKSSCINLTLKDKLGNFYSTKVFLKDIDNPIVQAFCNKEIIFKDDVNFLKLAYFKKNAVVILPLISVNKCIGVLIIEDNYARQNITLYNLIANFSALYSHNLELQEMSEGYANTDNLTLLYNHRGFQEILSNEISRAEINKQKLSIVMMDVCNITKINRELGHAKGDEVIKLVAEKVRQNMREGDIAGRYGGDEIAIIMPNTSIAQAKYVAEYLTYSLSCCFIDDIGPVKVSVGIATYPDCSEDKEKLLILAEQAMYISQAKGYKDGMSAIISSADFNFWDDVALKSYAEVIGKRHAQLGINFEDELISKFNADHAISGARISEIATSLAGAIDAKDPYTKGHSDRVAEFSVLIGKKLGLSEEDLKTLRIGGLFHDIGKIGIPDSIS